MTFFAPYELASWVGPDGRYHSGTLQNLWDKAVTGDCESSAGHYRTLGLDGYLIKDSASGHNQYVPLYRMLATVDAAPLYRTTLNPSWAIDAHEPVNVLSGTKTSLGFTGQESVYDTDLAWFIGFLSATGQWLDAEKQRELWIAHLTDPTDAAWRKMARICDIDINPYQPTGHIHFGELCNYVFDQKAKLQGTQLHDFAITGLSSSHRTVTVPDSIFAAEEDIRAAFLAGVVDGNTNRFRASLKLAAPNKPYATGLGLLLESLGCPSRIAERHHYWIVTSHVGGSRIVEYLALTANRNLKVKCGSTYQVVKTSELKTESIGFSCMTETGSVDISGFNVGVVNGQN